MPPRCKSIREAEEGPLRIGAIKRGIYLGGVVPARPSANQQKTPAV
jgi:hypothetical protein